MTVVVVVGRRKREMHVTVKPLTSLLKPAFSETLRLCKTFLVLFSHVPGTINAFPKTVSLSRLLFVFCDPFTQWVKVLLYQNFPEIGFVMMWKVYGVK
jgi:hypothetical protein